MFVGRSYRGAFPTGQRQGREGYFPPDLPPPQNLPRRSALTGERSARGMISGRLFYPHCYLGCVCKPSSRNRVTTGKCATMTSLKTSGSGLSPYCQQKVLLVEGDRLVTSETFSMLYIGCCEPDLHGELCQRNMVRGKPYIPDSGVGRKEDIWLLSLSFLPYRLTWTTS